MEMSIKVSKDQDKNWKNDEIQFARLIAELEAAGAFCRKNIMEDLCESMNLTKEQILEIVERASNRFDEIKGKL